MKRADHGLELSALQLRLVMGRDSIKYENYCWGFYLLFFYSAFNVSSIVRVESNKRQVLLLFISARISCEKKTRSAGDFFIFWYIYTQIICISTHISYLRLLRLIPLVQSILGFYNTYIFYILSILLYF